MTDYHLGVNKPPEDCRPSTLVGIGLQQAIDRAHKKGIDPGIIRDIWLTGLETLRITAMAEAAVFIRDHKSGPRVGTSMLILKTSQKATELEAKLKMLLEVLLPCKEL